MGNFEQNFQTVRESKLKAPLTDTFVSGQLYLRLPSETHVFLNSDTNSVFSYSPKRPAPAVTDTFRAPRVSAYESFDYIGVYIYIS